MPPSPKFLKTTLQNAVGGLTGPLLMPRYLKKWSVSRHKACCLSCIIKKAAGLDKASGAPNKTKVGTITLEQAKQIAQTKMPDLNAATLESATEMIKGTARSMGIVVTE